MELKSYQQRVINDLANFIHLLEEKRRINIAFQEYWTEQGVTRIESYKDNIPNVPHICAKVPTAGGKTFIAVNALNTIFGKLLEHNPNRFQFVVWLVPSLTILEQTVKSLSNPEHPYRQRLNLLFRNRVAIYEKQDLLMGADFSLDTAKEQLSIVVMSFDSLRAKKKEDRKIYQENGYLASFLLDEFTDNGHLLAEYDASALINVVRKMKPVVVVDESHNAETALSVEMLRNLNPDFILDLTATPKNNSNIISYVDAMQLKKNHMVKLPVTVANRQDKNEVIEAALLLRRQLENISIDEEAKGGKYIRPIVLFQAQPKTDSDNTTFEKIKETLIKLNIPEEQIKIKTSKINELKNIDLLQRDCPVRFIITVNALKEGWDCPFAYILASLADKSSAVDVEQLLGRILRMPHVQQHGHELLNMSYVFTASNRFAETLQSIVKGLNRAGFSNKDHRVFDPESYNEIIEPEKSQPVMDDLFFQAEESRPEPTLTNNKQADFDTAKINTSLLMPSSHDKTQTATGNSFVDAMTQQAMQQNKIYEQQAKSTTENSLPEELGSKMNKHRMKDIFIMDHKDFHLPQFFIKVERGGWFDDETQLLEREFLLRDFKLANLDATISFEDVKSEVYRVDLEEIGQEDYTPTPLKVDSKRRQQFNEIILNQSPESRLQSIRARLFGLIGNLYPIDDNDAKQYLDRIISDMNKEQIRDCLERDIAYARKIKNKIDELANTHAYKQFIDLLDIEKILIQPKFTLPENIIPKANAPVITKSLYVTEASMGNFEHRVINEIANLDNVLWWHRNLSRGKGFRINGYLNHYPDFIIKTKSGRVIILETKGDDRDNSDSELKLKLGKKWESAAGSMFKYMMVFDTNPIDGAEKLTSALSKINQL